MNGVSDIQAAKGPRLIRAMPWLSAFGLVAALGALLWMVSEAGRERDQALTWQRHSFEVINLTRRLEGTLAKSESTLARYVIGLDAQVGRVYQSQWALAGMQIERLRRQTRSDAEQQALIARLDSVYRTRGAALNDVALRVRYDQKAGALGRFYRAGKSETLDQIDGLIDRIIAIENKRLRERSEKVSQSQDWSDALARTWRIVGLILLVGAIGLGWATNAAFAERRRARGEAEDEARRADALQAAVAARTAELETANEALRQEAKERAAAEEHLRQLHKMEAVGQLTGGIAHDFNNMLAVVVGGLELAKRKLHENASTAERHLDNALMGADRAAALTRRLLAFARAEPLLPSAVDADQLIAGMTDLIDRTIGDQITVEIDTSAQGWAIWVDKHQLENAILNLAVNARDAMDGRGTLTIRTGQATLAQNEVGESMAGDYVMLSVEDTGCGMSPEVLARAFEPFFTTKPVGQGTGLGLSQIFGFVRRCEGEIRIVSEPGKGTEVQLYLPRRQSDDRPASHAAPRMLRLFEEATRVLVVEDDPRVLTGTMEAVRELGHVPVACEHPHKVAALLGQDGAGIGLIISDVLMPDMTGPEMIRALPEALRSIPVLFVTGFAGDVSDGEQFDGRPVLRKPYTLAALSAAIADALSHGGEKTGEQDDVSRKTAKA